MRQLLGKIPGNENIVEKVYLSEQVYCLMCQRTVPVGIEVVRTQKQEVSQKALGRRCYCRVHGAEYVVAAGGQQ
jgi:hypothetical protein